MHNHSLSFPSLIYYNVVYIDLMIKGLVRVFVSFQKENVFITLKKKKKKAFVVMQMTHTGLRRFILPEQVFTIIFCTLAVIFIVYSALVFVCKITLHQDQLCHTVLWLCPALAHAHVPPHPLLLYT